MRRYAAVLWGWLRRPVVQDVGLAGLLLVTTALLRERDVSEPAVDAPFVEPIPVWAWWSLVASCLCTVLVRRRWPFPALAVATLATVVQMALIAGPTPANLAVPAILYTIARQRPRKVSLCVLGGSLLVAACWSAYVVLDGKADGWLFTGPTLEAGVVAPSDISRPDAPLGNPPSPRPVELGPTDWGGFPILASVLVAGWAMGRSTRSRRAYLDELEARARDLERERDQRAALAVAAERSRITRELHDVVAHGLSVIVMQAQGGAAALDNRPADTRTALDAIVATGRASLADMRQVLAAVGPVDDGSPHPVPGLGRLPQLVEQVRQAGTPVLLHIEGSPSGLPTSVDLSAYRIVQEALTNTMKHAGPDARAQVLLSYGKDGLTIDVSDNGVGTPPRDGVGHGLRGMRERTTLLGGELSAGPGPSGGFVVRARIPFDSEPAG